MRADGAGSRRHDRRSHARRRGRCRSRRPATCSSPMRCRASASRLSCANAAASCKRPISSACSSRRPTRVHARVRVLRPLRRLRSAASRALGAGIVQAARRRRDVEAHRPRRARGVAAGRRQRSRGTIGAAPGSASSTSPARTACWSAFASARARTSRTCAIARCCVPPIDGLLGELAELIEHSSVKERLPQIEAAVADDAVALVLRVLAEPSAADIEAFREFGDASRHRPVLAARRSRHGRAARSCAAAALSLARVRPHARVPADGFRAGQRRHQRRARVDGRSLGRRRADGSRARSLLRARQFQLAARAARRRSCSASRATPGSSRVPCATRPRTASATHAS